MIILLFNLCFFKSCYFQPSVCRCMHLSGRPSEFSRPSSKMSLKRWVSWGLLGGRSIAVSQRILCQVLRFPVLKLAFSGRSFDSVLNPNIRTPPTDAFLFALNYSPRYTEKHNTKEIKRNQKSTIFNNFNNNNNQFVHFRATFTTKNEHISTLAQSHSSSDTDTPLSHSRNIQK